MKESVFENEFISSFIDSSKRIYYYHWKRANRTMTPEQYQAEITRQANSILHYHPQFVLVDFRASDFIIDPDLQEFVTQSLFQSLSQVGTQKLAILQTEDYVLQLSVIQTVDERKEGKYVVQYFSNPEEAEHWFEGKN